MNGAPASMERDARRNSKMSDVSATGSSGGNEREHNHTKRNDARDDVKHCLSHDHGSMRVDQS
eukprot:4901782-Alexandrium_andersonii.AAC.1